MTLAVALVGSSSLRLLETHAVEENGRRVLPSRVTYLKLFD